MPAPTTPAAFLAAVPMPWPADVDADVFAAYGQWVGGIGSMAGFAAVAVAVLALRHERRAAAAQRHADELGQVEREQAAERERHEHRLAQARTVIAARGRVAVEHPVYDGRGGFRLGSSEVFGLQVRNYGVRPVLEVMIEDITFSTGDPAVEHTSWVFQEPGGEPVREPFLLADVLGAGESAGQAQFGFDDVPDDVLRDQGTLTVTFSFLDAEGYRWRRVGTGKPVRIGEPADD
ncbi:hypothetical protein [Saccharothrix xinjiangensis]|uniref:DUF4352 domain-containing protein n=1 Tax=Saccharothrix xinjiangensis TaxID=204798 RepID=A0ABV9XTN7_9PSEU